MWGQGVNTVFSVFGVQCFTDVGDDALHVYEVIVRDYGWTVREGVSSLHCLKQGIHEMCGFRNRISHCLAFVDS